MTPMRTILATTMTTTVPTTLSATMAKPTMPKVVVITVTWNGRKWLGDFLSSTLAMGYPNFEVVVIDNASTDGSVEFVRENYPCVHVIETGENRGYAAGVNAGLDFAAARGADYFLIMNNDTVVDRYALSALVETAQSCERAGFVTGKVYLYDQPDTLHTVGKQADTILLNGAHIGWMEKDDGQFDAVAERAFVDDVMVLTRRQVYEDVGHYDTQFFLHSAEFDYQMRAKRKGWRIYYTPGAKLWHRISMSLGGIGSPTARYFYTCSHMIVLARYASPASFLRYYFSMGFQNSNTLLRALIQLDAAKLRPRLATMLGFLDGTLFLIHRRPRKSVPWYIKRLNQ